MLTIPVSASSPSPPHDHPRMLRRISTPHATLVKECDVATKTRPRSGSLAGSAAPEHHQITVNFTTGRQKTHFLSHFTKHYPTNDRYTRSLPKLPCRENIGYVYNASERSVETLKRRKGPLSGIGKFFRRLRQNNDPVYPKEIQNAKSPASEYHKVILDTEESLQRERGITTKSHLLHTVSPDPLESETPLPRERSKRESLQAHLRYFGLDLNSLSPLAESNTAAVGKRTQSKSIEEVRPKPNDSRSSSPSAEGCVRKDTETEATKSSVSLSRMSCHTCESMYNTYTTYRQSQYSVTELAPVAAAAHHDCMHCDNNNQQQRPQYSPHTGSDNEEEDEPFVDVTATQDRNHSMEGRADQLRKRLSGGHFGSAGGLVMSVSDFLARPLPSTAKRHSTCALETSTRKDDNVTSYGGERRFSEASAHTVVGVLLAAMDRSSNNSTCTSQTEDEENKPPFHEREKRSSKHHQQDSVEILPDLNEKAENFVNPEETEEEQAKLAARRIWVEDSSFQEDMERVAEWLGAR